jgi:5-methylcytosine-specific restriction endonuclease McrA
MDERLPKFTTKVCRTHGRTEFVLEGRGYYRCKECRKQRVLDWRRRAKALLIEEAGGSCRICGYDRYKGALHFHHIDARQKQFGISRRGFTRSIAKMRAEAAKCVLLCSNCHAEVEAGIAKIPAAIRSGVTQMSSAVADPG